MNEIHVRHYTLSRERKGITGLLDIRLDENSTLYLNGIWTEMKDDELRRRFRHRPEKGDLQPDGSFKAGRLVYQHKDRLEILQSWNITLGGENLYENDFQLDYHVTVTQSKEKTPSDTEIEFVQKKVDFFPDISDPDNIRSNPEAGAIAGKFKFDNIEPARSITENKDWVAAVNLTIPYQFGDQAAGKLKIGGKFRKKDKFQDVFESVWELNDAADDIILGQGFGVPFSNAGYNPGNYPFPPMVPGEQEVREFVDNHKSDLVFEYVNEDDVEDYDSEEKTYAFYAMTEINFTPEFMLLAGARFERTELNNKGFTFNANTGTLSPTSAGSGDYNRFFPSVHVRYRLTPRTNIRAAISTALLRPNFYDLVPFIHRDDEDRSLGNPDLKPATSTNLDLLFEHYFRPLGLLSGGLFYKKIKDPIFRFTKLNEFGGNGTRKFIPA